MPIDTLQKQNGTPLNQIQKDKNVKVQSNGLIIHNKNTAGLTGYK